MFGGREFQVRKGRSNATSQHLEGKMTQQDSTGRMLNAATRFGHSQWSPSKHAGMLVCCGWFVAAVSDHVCLIYVCLVS